MSRKSGFTLIEVLLAMGLLSVVIVSTFSYLYTVKRAEEIDKTVTDLNIIVQNQMELVMAAETVTEMYSMLTIPSAYQSSASFQGWVDNPPDSAYRAVGDDFQYAIGAYQLKNDDGIHQSLYQFAVFVRKQDEPERRVVLMTIRSLEEL